MRPTSPQPLPLSVPIFLSGLCLLAYGLMIPWLGLYADDWTFLWTSEVLGKQGELRYFTVGGNRPVWGLFYHYTIPMIGHQPWAWHLFGIFWLWACATLVWWLVRLVWPGHEEAAVLAAGLFTVYPGMQLQFISLTFGHMWLIYAIFLLSLSLSVLSVLHSRHYFIFSVFAVLTATINLLTFEYFILLELVRPVLLWLVIHQREEARIKHITRTIKVWLPYALLFGGILVWRSFFFVLQNIRYQITLVDRLNADLSGTFLSLSQTILKDIFWETSLLAWGQALTLPFGLDWDLPAPWVYLFLCLLAFILVFYYLNHVLDQDLQRFAPKFPLAKTSPNVEKIYLRDFDPTSGRSTQLVAAISLADEPETQSKEFEPGKNLASNLSTMSSSLQMIGAGLLAMFMAGWPFWMTELNVTPVSWTSRFTMPFILGISLTITGLLSSLTANKVRRGASALLIGMAIGLQFQVANDFRWDWELSNRFLWQLSWRIPGLKPGTTLLTDELPFKYLTDNTLSAQLNWITARGSPKYSVDYFLGYLREMRRFGHSFQEKGLPIKRDMISIDFHGNTDHVVGIHYNPGACLRILDSRFDTFNPLISVESRELAAITNPNLILLDRIDFVLPESVYGQERRDYWCFRVQKADIARQTGNWEEIVDQGEQLGFMSDSLYRDPMIAMIFIEGLTRTGEVSKALSMSEKAGTAAPAFSSVLCRFWEAIEPSLEHDPFIQDEIMSLYNQLGC